LIELVVEHEGRDLRYQIQVGPGVLYIMEYAGKGIGAERKDAAILDFGEHVAVEKKAGEWKPPVERPLLGVRSHHDSTPGDAGERGGGNQPPGWTAASDPGYLASVARYAAALAPERIRRTDDGTYPNVEEELEKARQRALARPLFLDGAPLEKGQTVVAVCHPCGTGKWIDHEKMECAVCHGSVHDTRTGKVISFERK
jgi:hypothetical protein